ncbi:MAG: protein kinase [Sandaracinaceae bacterium]
MAPSIPQELGPYRIVRPIAVGGMAEVYLARQRGLEGLERTVVIKKILDQHAHNEEFITMFLDEARLLAGLTHPHIAQVFDLGRVGKTYYIAMEYVPGPTLGKLLAAARERERARTLPLREGLGVALALADALRYLHGQVDDLGRLRPVVHRDLNPSNVIVSYDGAVKLIDFGIAKAASKVYETRTGVFKGTFGYSAPEQILAQRDVDHRADVYAFGVLLYELCTGQHPFDHGDAPDLTDRLLAASYRRPWELRRDLPDDLDSLIVQCLEPVPKERPPSIRSVIGSLTELLERAGMVPTPTGIGEAVTRLVPREGSTPRPTVPVRRERADATRPVRPVATRTTGTVTTEPRIAVDPTEDGPTTLRPSTGEDEEPGTRPTGSPSDVAMLALLDELDEEPGTEPPRVSARRGDPTRREGRGAAAIDPPTDVPLGEPRARLGPARLLLVAALGIPLAVGLGYVGMRTLLAPPIMSPEGAGSTDVEHGPTELRVLSEPAGASVHLDGRDTGVETPITLHLPAGRATVSLRLELDGYLDQEREVDANAGMARFVLSPEDGPRPPQ